ncbi:MAG: hypothetical protein ACRD4K_00525 [Candidatus Acidiferrales bacterium]
MLLSPFGYTNWVFITALEVLTCCLALYRGLFHRLPIFTTYLVLLVLNECIWWPAYHLLDVRSNMAFFIYWVLQAILLMARGAVIAEICWKLLRDYSGIWRLARQALTIAAVILVLLAIPRWNQRGPRLSLMVLSGERGLEFAVVVILLIGLSFCRYYRIHIEIPFPLILLGLGIYSAMQVVNNALLEVWKGSYFEQWNTVRGASFEFAIILWSIALRKPLPEIRRAPALLSPEVYLQVSPEMNQQLRELNQRLQEMWKWMP